MGEARYDGVAEGEEDGLVGGVADALARLDEEAEGQEDTVKETRGVRDSVRIEEVVNDTAPDLVKEGVEVVVLLPAPLGLSEGVAVLVRDTEGEAVVVVE